jgi:hypothetical protein
MKKISFYKMSILIQLPYGSCVSPFHQSNIYYDLPQTILSFPISSRRDSSMVRPAFFSSNHIILAYYHRLGTISIGFVGVFLLTVSLPLGWYYILNSKPKVFKPTENGGTCIGKLKASPPVE